jgi:nucleoside 2-deoxyribosyltransferase
MKVYLAAAYARRDEIADHARYLQWKSGIEVVSSWLDETYSPTIDITTLPGGINQALAEKDVQEINSCDLIIFFAENQNNQPPRGGRHVEFGIALALGKRIIVVGERENIFHHLPQVVIVDRVSQIEGLS